MKNNNLLLQVQEALREDTRLRSFLDHIYILVNDGTVIMAGSVAERSLKTLACNIVSQLPGVVGLIDDLRIDAKNHERVGVQIDWAKGHMALV